MQYDWLNVAMYARHLLQQGILAEDVERYLARRYPGILPGESAQALELGQEMENAANRAVQLGPNDRLIDANPPRFGPGNQVVAEGIVTAGVQTGQRVYLTLRINLPWHISVEDYQAYASAAARELGSDSVTGNAQEIEFYLTSMWVH